MSDETENANLNSIYIHPDTDGNITISAEISKFNDEETAYEYSKDTSLMFAATQIPDPILASDTFEWIIDSDTYNTSDETAVRALLTGLNDIPAFYTSGTVTINFVVKRTKDPDKKIDLTWDCKAYFPTPPTWYPYDLTLNDGEMADALYGLITSNGENVAHETVGKNTNFSKTFGIGTWPDIRPVLVKFVLDSDGNSIKRGCLPPAVFKITCTNNLAYDVELSSVTVNFSFSYAADGMMMDMDNSSRSEVAKLYCAPKKAATNKMYLWAITDGYEKDEIIRVFGYYNKLNVDGNYKVSTVLNMIPVAGIDDTNNSPYVYRSDVVISSVDTNRMAYGGITSDEYAKVLTDEVICTEARYRDLDIVVVDGKDPNESDAVFEITVVPRTDTDELLTESEIISAIESIKFYDITKDYEGPLIPILITRAEINPVFYDSLSDYFESAVILVPPSGKLEPMIELNINDKTGWLPITNSTSITFRESLTKCTDGIRSRDIFYYGTRPSETTVVSDEELVTYSASQLANSYAVRALSKNKYKVKIHTVYGRYKKCYVHKDIEVVKEET
jgi:hypothetical protein